MSETEAPSPDLSEDEKIIDEAQLRELPEINVDYAEIDQPADEDADDEASSEPPVDEDA